MLFVNKQKYATVNANAILANNAVIILVAEITIPPRVFTTPPMSPSVTPTPRAPDDDDGLSAGVIATIVVVCTLVLAVGIFGAIYYTLVYSAMY